MWFTPLRTIALFLGVPAGGDCMACVPACAIALLVCCGCDWGFLFISLCITTLFVCGLQITVVFGITVRKRPYLLLELCFNFVCECCVEIRPCPGHGDCLRTAISNDMVLLQLKRSLHRTNGSALLRKCQSHLSWFESSARFLLLFLITV